MYIQEITAKSISIAKESIKYFNGVGAQLGHRIAIVVDLLLTKEDPPRIWHVHGLATTPRLIETLRFSVLEVQEHLETFFDRKDHALEVTFLIQQKIAKCYHFNYILSNLTQYIFSVWNR